MSAICKKKKKKVAAILDSVLVFKLKIILV